MQQHQPAAQRRRQIQIVRRQHHRHALLGVQLLQQHLHFELVADVERRRRLVEQQQLCALRQRAGDHDALFFAAAERAERAVLERRGAGGGERPARDGQILGTFERERAEMGKPSHQHDVEDGEIERRVRFLRNERDAPRDLAVRPVGERTTVERHRAAGRTVHAAEQLEQRRLAGSVRPENADQLAALDVQEDIVQDRWSRAGPRSAARAFRARP